jgi:peptide/nickel transport system permease protein
LSRYIVRRVLRAAVLYVAIILLVFVVTHVIGDPVARSLPLDATPAQYQARSHALGLDRPLWDQFTDYMSGALRLDFGDSFTTRQPAMDLVLERVPRTFELVAAGMLLAALIGLPLGIALGLSNRRWFLRLGNTLSLVALSVPQFWIGIILILVFAVELGWFPTGGLGGLSYLILPAVTLSLTTAGRVAQITSATIRDELAKPYVRTARAKGMPTRRVIVHSLRNASVPITTVFSYEAITALAGYAILVETVFAWPGIGYKITESVRNLDLPLTAATAVTIALIVTVGNTLVEFVYRALDPRIAVED